VADEYSERTGIIQFNSDFTAYTWRGINKSGRPEQPRIFEYEEQGRRVGNR
jgi:hypothetical protein